MDINKCELIMKLDYSNSQSLDKFISLIKKTNLNITKIGVDEYSIIIKE